MSGNIVALRIEGGTLQPLQKAQPHNLDWLQRQVGGYIEVVLREHRGHGIVVLGNEDGRYLFPAQCIRFDGQTLHGPLLVLGQTGANFRELEGAEAQRVQLIRREPLAPLPLLTIAERQQ